MPWPCLGRENGVGPWHRLGRDMVESGRSSAPVQVSGLSLRLLRECTKTRQQDSSMG